jgi:hypothetical protein
MTTTIITTIVSFLTAAGIGGIIGAYFQTRFQRRTQIGQHEHDLKRKRYQCILMLMRSRLEPDLEMPKLRDMRPDLKNLDDVNTELETELLNGIIFANDEVLESLAAFIREPNHRSFVHTAASMRKDLWGKKTKVNEKMLDVVGKFHKKDQTKLSQGEKEIVVPINK